MRQIVVQQGGLEFRFHPISWKWTPFLELFRRPTPDPADWGVRPVAYLSPISNPSSAKNTSPAKPAFFRSVITLFLSSAV